jgi:hypothetical protein
MVLPSFPPDGPRKGTATDSRGRPIEYDIIDEVWLPQSRYSDGATDRVKMLVLQRVRFETGPTELRFGYYNLIEDRWVWGRFAAFAPEEDFLKLFDQARVRGWFS